MATTVTAKLCNPLTSIVMHIYDALTKLSTMHSLLAATSLNLSMWPAQQMSTFLDDIHAKSLITEEHVRHTTADSLMQVFVLRILLKIWGMRLNAPCIYTQEIFVPYQQWNAIATHVEHTFAIDNAA